MDTKYGIILGCPRSGTTYLLSVINTIPEAACLNGMLLPTSVPHIVNQDLNDEIYDTLAVGFERAIDEYLRSGHYHSRAAAIQKWFAAPNGLSGLVKALRNSERAMPRHFIYKEPFLSLAPDFVLDALPDAKIVHIYRDGRDCANSLVRSYEVLTDEKLTDLRSTEMRMGRPYDHRYVPWWIEEGRDEEFINSSPYVRSIWMWKYMVRRCHDFFSRPDVAESGQVMHLRYEDFMREPQTYGQAVLEHFGLSSSLAFRRRLQQARTTSIGKHERRPQEEVEAAERIAGPELALYGYIESSEEERHPAYT